MRVVLDTNILISACMKTGGLEARLDGKRFLRIHRSFIVNIERIRELQPAFHGDYVIILQDGTELTLSRGYRDKLQELLRNSL